MKKDTPLCKYYVQSGPSRWVLLAPDLDGAAIRFAHCVLRDCVRSQHRATSAGRLIDQQIYETLMDQFESTVVVSESGFEGDQIGIFATTEVLTRWRQQMDALETKIRNSEN